MKTRDKRKPAMLKTPAMDSDEVVAFMRIFIAHHDG